MTENRADALELLTRYGCFAADVKLLAAPMLGLTGAQRTRLAIVTALDELERQGFIRFVPEAECPDHLELSR